MLPELVPSGCMPISRGFVFKWWPWVDFDHFYDRVSWCFCMGDSLYSIECSCISKLVLIQHILSTPVSDTGPMVSWFVSTDRSKAVVLVVFHFYNGFVAPVHIIVFCSLVFLFGNSDFNSNTPLFGKVVSTWWIPRYSQTTYKYLSLYFRLWRQHYCARNDGKLLKIASFGKAKFKNQKLWRKKKYS